MAAIDFPRVATISQAAAESGVPVYRIRQLCKAGTVRSVQCGRKVLVNLSSLAAWMDGGEPPQQPGIHRVEL
ncbi:helix-turn-helix domain-containing protein [Gemmiger sp.]